MKKASIYKEFSNSVTYAIEAKEDEYLYVEQSQIPGAGNGLFTAIPIYKDEVISIFKGEFLSPAEAKARAEAGEDGYFINMPDGVIMDSKKVKCFAKYANDAAGAVKSNYKNNAYITLDEMGNPCIVAKRTISAKEEIFCGYGTKYWNNHKKKTEAKQAKTVSSPDESGLNS